MSDEKVVSSPECGCGKPSIKTAHDTGIDWLLYWGCENENCDGFYNHGDRFIDWPFKEEYASAEDLEAVGFLIM